MRRCELNGAFTGDTGCLPPVVAWSALFESRRESGDILKSSAENKRKSKAPHMGATSFSETHFSERAFYSSKDGQMTLNDALQIHTFLYPKTTGL